MKTHRPVDVLDEKALTAALRKLDKSSRVAFASACAERLLRGVTGPRSRALQNLLGQLWIDLIQGNSAKSAEKAVLEARALVPPEESPDWEPHLEDAAAAVTYALRCFTGGAVDDARTASSRVFDLIDFELSKREDGEGEEWEDHPLVVAEVERQSRDLRELAEATVSIDGLRVRAASEGKRLIPTTRSRKS